MKDASEWKQDEIVLATPELAAKVCHRCGLDLTGNRRFRDSRGYWCVACSKADKEAYRADHVPCDDCGDDVQRGRLEGIL